MISNTFVGPKILETSNKKEEETFLNKLQSTLEIQMQQLSSQIFVACLSLRLPDSISNPGLGLKDTLVCKQT